MCFSGSSDPSWVISGSKASELYSRFQFENLPFANDQSVERPIPWFRMGYRGFVVSLSGVTSPLNGIEFVVYNDHEFERALLQTGGVLETVRAHVSDEISRVALLDLKQSKIGGLSLAEKEKSRGITRVGGGRPVRERENCTLPVRGPDDSCKYDPKTENCGFFVKYESQNNCYNYGNNIVTNTFAQPGRGSGKKWTKNTCGDMQAASERDGLFWNGTSLPSSQAPNGHYVALLIWPDTNFHWIRLDDDPTGMWSHKPGGTPARNVDNNNKKITDPSKSDFSPWTQFCGYMSTVPSTVSIN